MNIAISFEEWKAAVNEVERKDETLIQLKPDDTWLMPKEFSLIYRLSTKHIYEILLQGRLPAVKIPGMGWRINRTVFEKQLADGLYRRRAGDVSS